MNRSVYILLLFLSSFSVYGQGGDFWEIGIFIGQSTYQGDITEPNIRIANSSLAGGLVTRYNYLPNVSFRGNLLFSRFSDQDMNYESRTARGYSFETTIVEFSVMPEYEPLGQLREDKAAENKFFASPYISGGIGFAFVNPQPEFDEFIRPGNLSPEEQDLQASFSKVRLTIPIGGGIKLNLSKDWTGVLEVGARYAFTDYLDGISIAANPDKNDWYWLYGLSVFYRMQ